jgi:mitogen-activated protein kinase 1/3
MKNLLTFLNSFKYRPKIDLREKFPEASKSEYPSVLDLLSRLICFNPDKRLDVSGAMEHPFLKSIRHENKIEVRTPRGGFTNPPHVSMTFDENEDLSKSQLKKLLREESLQYLLEGRKCVCPRP